MRISDWSSDVCSSDLWRFIRWFHRPARHIMVATRSLQRELAAQGLGQTMMWERGVDHALFRHDRAPRPALTGLPRPVQLYVGRVAVAKHIGAFLSTEEQTYELQYLMRISYPAVCLKKTYTHITL